MCTMYIYAVPGIMGSQMEAKLSNATTDRYCYKTSDWYRIWYSLEDGMPLAQDCFLKNTV